MLYDIEVHSVEGIKRYFDEGGDPNEINNGMPLLTMMVEMYMRSPRFKDCVQAFIDYGLVFEDKALLAVLTDDTEKLEVLIKADQTIVYKTYHLFNNTYTPLIGGTLLHFVLNTTAFPAQKYFYSMEPMLMQKPLWITMALEGIHRSFIQLIKMAIILQL